MSVFFFVGVRWRFRMALPFGMVRGAGGAFVIFRGGRVPCLVANVSRAATHRTGRPPRQGLTPLVTAHTLHSRAGLPMGGLSEADDIEKVFVIVVASRVFPRV